MVDLRYSPRLLREAAREAVSLERTLARVTQSLDVQIILDGEPWDPTLPPQEHLDF